MAQVIRETKVIDTDGRKPVVAERTPGSIAAQIIYMIGSVIVALLTLRLILAMLGANASNAFANFIYSITLPLVAPFFGLFNYRVQYGVGRFEFETLIAIIVYTLLAWFVVRMLSIGRGVDTDV